MKSIQEDFEGRKLLKFFLRLFFFGKKNFDKQNNSVQIYLSTNKGGECKSISRTKFFEGKEMEVYLVQKIYGDETFSSESSLETVE